MAVLMMVIYIFVALAAVTIPLTRAHVRVAGDARLHQRKFLMELTEKHGTVRRQADVAVLYNRTSGILESYDSIEKGMSLAENSWERDAQFIYWALRHAGYNVDVIPEEDFNDVTDDALNDYKVLYVNGVNIRQDTADTIAFWLFSTLMRTRSARDSRLSSR